ncbi:MAG: MFS transporter [Acidimicrobiia bacterium]
MTPSPPSRSLRDWLAILCIGVGTAVVPLDSATNIAFPDITESFAIEIVQIQWVVIAYGLTFTSLTLLGGRLGDRYGRRLIFGVGAVWNTLAFIGLTLAPTFPLFLAARFAQGVGAALVLSCGPALITSLADEDRRARMLGLYMLMFGVAQTLGPSIGGAVVEAFGWPGVYAMRLPLCLLALLLLWALPGRKQQAKWKSGMALNVPGGLMLAVAVATVLFAINRLQVPATQAWIPAGLAIAAAALIRAFVRHEARSPAPILPLGLFRRRDFTGMAGANGLVAFSGFAVMLIAPYFLLRLTQLDVTVAGVVLATSPLGIAVSSARAGWLIEKLGARRTAALAAASTAIGLVGVGLWPPSPGLFLMIVPLFLTGTGLGLFQVASMDVITGTMSLAERGVAGSLTMVTRTFGVIAGASLLSLAFATLGGGSDATDDAFLHAFRWIFLAAAIPPALVAIAMLGARDRTAQTVPSGDPKPSLR